MKDKFYYGIPPKNDSYFCIGSIQYDGNWDVYFLVNAENTFWLNFKLVFNGKREHKANFWLAYNYDEQRFADNACYKALVKNYNDLIPKIIYFVNENKNCFNVAK
jgi:hypothetical protein